MFLTVGGRRSAVGGMFKAGIQKQYLKTYFIGMRERKGRSYEQSGGRSLRQPEGRSHRRSEGRMPEVVGVLLMTVALFLAISLVSYSQGDYSHSKEVKNWAGRAGAYLADRFFFIFGYGWMPLPVIMLLLGWNCFRRNSFRSMTVRSVSLLFLVFLYCTVVYLPLFDDAHTPFRLGGLVGSVLSSQIVIPYFGRVGGMVLIGALGLLTVIFSTDLNVSGMAQQIADRVTLWGSSFVGRLEKRSSGGDETEGGEKGEEIEEVTASIGRGKREKTVEGIASEVRVKRESVVAPSMIDLHRPKIVENHRPKQTSAQQSEKAGTKVSRLDDRTHEETDERDVEMLKGEREDEPWEDEQVVEPLEEIIYQYPPVSLLDDPPGREERQTARELQENAERLEKALADFGIEARVVQVTPGPVITRYEVEPAPGTKVSRIVTLSDDLALVMKARRIRIQAPIPGKAAIGIELPNPKPSVVYLKEVVESEEFQQSPSKLLLALGRTASGDPFCADLAKMPHLLIAGSTGSGKSVCINALISSLLFRASPEEARLLLIDPKRIELAVYADIPHLLAPVVVEAKLAAETLKWAVEEMERRYQRLAEVGVRNITDHNRRTDVQPMPFVVIIVDELADLMMVGSRDIEEHIARLAQMARAVGIHLILATQRPSVNVITGVIKANFPARIAFQVASKIDSRIVLDTNGAENLLGSGDMLYLPPGESEPIRIHGAYVSTQETESLVEFIRVQRIQAERVDVSVTGEEDTGRFEGRDDLFEAAAKTVVHYQQGSASLLQRRLKVGYARAARLIDELEAAGIVGPAEGSRSREVLVDEDLLEEMFGRDDEQT